MKLTSVLLAFVLFAPCLPAAAPYPSVLTVKYKDQRLPVVHVHTTDPVVLVNGKEKEIWKEPDYLVQEATGFADNFIDSPAGSLGGPFHLRFIGGGSGPYSTMTYIEVPLTARKTIKRGFAIAVIYADASKSNGILKNALGVSSKDPKVMSFLETFLGGTSIIVHELPELPAGKATTVKFTAGGAVALLATDYFIQVFDDEGREVRTTDVAHAWQFYALRDRARLAQAVEKYLEKFKGADHDAVPAMMHKPIFPSGAAMPAGQVVVTLTVEPDGAVSEVDADQVKDDAVRQNLTDAMGGWLFLPKLKAGVPVATKVSLPLQF